MKQFVLVLLLMMLVVFGCSKDDDDSSPTGVTNNAPTIRSITSNPVNVGRQQSAYITCVATDSDGDSLTYFWRATSGSISGDDETIRWSAPSIDGNYWVAVTVSDGREVAIDSLELTVSAPNEPPARPWDPIPRDRDLVCRPVNLTWKCSDIDGDPILYDLYFGTSSGSTSVIQRDLDTTSYVLNNLCSESWYYWKVNSSDNQGNTSFGQVWSFGTE
jgi:hypothetical protein